MCDFDKDSIVAVDVKRLVYGQMPSTTANAVGGYKISETKTESINIKHGVAVLCSLKKEALINL